MANIFETFGRVDVTKPVERVADLVFKAKEMRLREEEGARAQEMQGAQLETMGVQRQALGEQVKAARYLNEQTAKAEAEKNKIVPLDVYKNMLGQSSSWPKIYDAAGQLGVLEKEPNTGVEGISGYGIETLQKFIQTNKAFDKELTLDAFRDAQGRLNQIDQALANPKIKPEEAQSLQSQKDQLIETTSGLWDEIKMLDETIRLEAAKGDIETAKNIATEQAKAKYGPKSYVPSDIQKQFDWIRAAGMKSDLTDNELFDELNQRRDMSIEAVGREAYLATKRLDGTKEEAEQAALDAIEFEEAIRRGDFESAYGGIKKELKKTIEAPLPENPTLRLWGDSPERIRAAEKQAEAQKELDKVELNIVEKKFKKNPNIPKGSKLGNKTDKGYEILDSSNKVIGHFK